MKKCKGNYKTRHFKGCGKESYIYKYGLCRSCFMSWCFDTEDGQEYYSKQFKPAALKEKAKCDIKEMKENVTNYRKMLQGDVQLICRLIDYGQRCTARPEVENKKMNGGHVFPKGGHPECRYNLHNIHIQSEYSNTYRNDDGLMRDGLERIYGKEYRLFVESLPNKRTGKLTDAEVKEKHTIALQIIKRLKSDLRMRNKEERIILRNEVNKELGIYNDELSVFVLY